MFLLRYRLVVPSKHCAPFHPFLQPSLQVPVKWWQIPELWQNALHLCRQSMPYFPVSQTKISIKLLVWIYNKKTCSKNKIILYGDFWAFKSELHVYLLRSKPYLKKRTSNNLIFIKHITYLKVKFSLIILECLWWW